MAELENLTSQQLIVLKKFSSEAFLKDNFYFTGGTALSSVYLNHRYSDDLDFFSYSKFDNFGILSLVQTWSTDLKVKVTSRNIGNIYNFALEFSSDYSLKLDFAHYPYKNVGPFTLIPELNIKVDSLKDIAVNKFVTVGQRTDIKDFVDLYFLLKDFNIFDLMEWSNIKFKRKYDWVLFASYLLKVEQFEYMPRMITNLSLETVRSFFMDMAKRLGAEVTAL